MTEPARAVVVVGASAGGIEPLLKLVEALPADLAAAVLIVLHISPDHPSVLAEILDRAAALPVVAAQDGRSLRPGCITVAPPDRHLEVRAGRIRLQAGARESGSRPSVDVLFRSAAKAFGPRCVGVVLSGALEDGTAGVSAIKEAGGRVIVQLPEDAANPSMPRSALEHTAVDHVAPAPAIGPLVVDLLRAMPAAGPAPSGAVPS